MTPFVLSTETPYFYTPISRLAAKPAIPKTFNFATYNAHFAKRPREIAEAINLCPALKECDMIALQEVEAYPDETAPRIETIARLCGYHSLYAPAREQKRRGRTGTHGLAILSRHKLEDIDVFELPRYELGPKTRRRICMTCKVSLGSETVRIYNAHLDTRITAEERIAQLEPIVRDASRFPGEKIVIAGDINTIPSLKWAKDGLPIWRMGQRLIIDNYMREQGFHFIEPKREDYTMRFGIKMMLDAVYVKNISILESSIEYDVKNSDHFPLRTKLRLS
ncbi:MAG TPA: endonuclease/exonuclease/phosphatase family protein [Candidatus Paceibacterota bacterium]|jgi:endonuclease/exonuclease/phosphatase family metal-dependent hydrolase|nr:endonuclease/exonuclease/phosphatase family protein [Candidatus Paceibacterota bacterium]